jgi:hypothetical protein
MLIGILNGESRVDSPADGGPVVNGANVSVSGNMKGGTSGTPGWAVWSERGLDPLSTEFEGEIARADGDEPAHRHYSALYRVADVNTQFMVDKPLARPCQTPLFRADYVIKGEVVVTDIDHKPVENLRVYWSGTPNVPQYMYDLDGNVLQPGTGNDAGKYFTTTDTAGRAIVYFGHTEPTIISFQACIQNGYRACTPIVFSNLLMADSTTKSAWQAPLPAGRLPVNLNSPGETVPIVLPSAVRASKTVAQIAVVLNGAAALVGYPTQTIDEDNIVQLPKKYFLGNGQRNHIGFITIDRAGGGAESRLTDFVATGGRWG